MEAALTLANSGAIKRPLKVSLVLTGLAVGILCKPPAAPLHGWGQLISRASLYLLLAAATHALAVWGMWRRLRNDGEADRSHLWPLIWIAWIAIVWLPLIALLTREHSDWIVIFEPLVGVLVMLILRWDAVPEARMEAPRTRQPTVVWMDDSPALWRVLLPAVVLSIMLQVGGSLMIAGEKLGAGAVLTAGAFYLLECWLRRPRLLTASIVERSSRRVSAINSLAVWLLLAVALTPFLAYYGSIAGGMRNVMAMHVPALKPPPPANATGKNAAGYSGIILVQPPKPHEIVAPVAPDPFGSLGKPRVIEFDGAYWYFKAPDTQPEPTARVAHGDPIKNHIFSTNLQPLQMEAHQPLGRPLALSCCRSLRVQMKNADNVPGKISVEVLLRDTSSKRIETVSLGTIVLPSSAVSPMPLHRAPVEEALTFKVPTTARGKTFNEITVRITPEHGRSLAGAQVAVENFVLQP